jgi:hypothetical protein
MTGFFKNEGEAKIHFGASDFTILEGGSYVVCAVTGKQIPLEELRYWNDDRQEAYVDAAASMEGFKRAGAL